MKIKILILTILLASQLLNAQTRGTSPGELYFSTTWYYTDTEQYDMIMHSTNNGKNFKPTYVYKHDSGNTPVGSVLADATPGVLYMTSNNKLHISYDSTKSWEFVETYSTNLSSYFSGEIEEVIYKTIYNEERHSVELFKSNNQGNSFYMTNDSVIGHWGDVGNNGGGALYLYRIIEWPRFKMEYIYCTNNGETLQVFEIDSIIAGGRISGHYPELTRGYNAGELYLVSWHLPANYKIFRSTNYGETFTLQYEQPDTCDFYYEGYGFTAGRDPGEFYIFKNIPWFDGTNTCLSVYYSNDYAKSFTEYVHVFDKNWTSVNEQLVMSNGQLKNYPNPFNDGTTISYSEHPLNNAVVEIFNINGVLIETLPMNDNSLEWNSGNNKPGIYLYRIKAENYISETQTMIIQ